MVKNFGRVTSSFDELKSGTVREVLPTSYDLHFVEDFDQITLAKQCMEDADFADPTHSAMLDSLTDVLNKLEKITHGETPKFHLLYLSNQTTQIVYSSWRRYQMFYNYDQ